MQAFISEIDRRAFLRLAGAGLGAAAFGATSTTLPGEELIGLKAVTPKEPVLRIEADPKRACVAVLSWDTEGGNKAQTNLLRADSPLVLRVRVGGEWRVSSDLQTHLGKTGDGETSYALSVSTDAELHWSLRPSSGSLIMTVSGQGSSVRDIEAVEMHFPFDPLVTPTTILPQTWREDGSGSLPAVLSSPDWKATAKSTQLT